MAGVTKEEIARAKELDLLTYFKLVEPGNLKLVGKEYRHKVHSSLTISKDSLWCWHCIGLRGRTALKYLIDVEKVPYVEAVREINRIQGGVVHSSQPVSLPQPRAEPQAGHKQLFRYGVSARALYPPQCAGILPQGGHFVPDELQESPELRICWT